VVFVFCVCVGVLCGVRFVVFVLWCSFWDGSFERGPENTKPFLMFFVCLFVCVWGSEKKEPNPFVCGAGTFGESSWFVVPFWWWGSP